MPSSLQPRFAVVIPACNEEACIVQVLGELRSVLNSAEFIVAVGVNGSSDQTAQLARECGVIVAVTAARGYGHGCQAAINEVESLGIPVSAWIFFAADGANDPRDIHKLVAAHQQGAALVLGSRTLTRANWSRMNLHYVLVNRCFGLFCGLLTGRVFSDLGPLRLVERELFTALSLREWTYGWTIEAQVRAVLLGATIREVAVRERGRLAGEQKVSHVSWGRTVRVGCHILAAGIRASNRARYGSRAKLWSNQAGEARLAQSAAGEITSGDAPRSSAPEGAVARS